MGEANRRKKFRNSNSTEGNTAIFVPGGKAPFTKASMLTMDNLFAEKHRIRATMLSYLEKYADAPNELAAFAAAASNYCLQADDGDPEMTVKMLRDMAEETEKLCVPYLDHGGIEK